MNIYLIEEDFVKDVGFTYIWWICLFTMSVILVRLRLSVWKHDKLWNAWKWKKGGNILQKI